MADPPPNLRFVAQVLSGAYGAYGVVEFALVNKNWRNGPIVEVVDFRLVVNFCEKLFVEAVDYVLNKKSSDTIEAVAFDSAEKLGEMDNREDHVPIGKTVMKFGSCVRGALVAILYDSKMEVCCSFIIFVLVILIVTANFVKIYHKMKGKMSLLKVLLALATFTSVSFVFTICTPFLWLYKKLLKIYLKIKHGSKFIGMAENGDVAFVSISKRDVVASYLLILEVSEETPPHQVYETMKDTVSKHFLQNRNKLSKLNSVLHYYGGHCCMLKEDSTVEHCLKKLRVVENRSKLSKEELMQLMSECQYKSLPKNNSILWDCSIGVQPVEWGDSTKPKMNHYPVLFRTHHFIGDGFAFIQFLFGVVADKSDNPDICPKVYLSKVQELRWPFNVLNNAVLVLYVLIYLPFLLFHEFILAENVKVLRTTKPNNVDILATKVDDGQYFAKIKRIRNGVKDTNFSTVLFTALSLSLQENLRKNSSDQPKSLILTVPSLPKSVHLSELPVGKLTIDNISLTNSVFFYNMNLPLFPKDAFSLEERLKLTQREANGLSKSASGKFGMRLAFQLLPLPIVSFILNSTPVTFSFSILPGTEKTYLSNGVFCLRDCIFWSPHLKIFNCHFSALTYDNRLHIAVKVDTAVVRDREEVQSILDGVFKYIDLLDKEINQKNNFY
ncbi:hypothetical protein FQA39_LY16948 [Lamprigera yunnana]|nr:hypothetical protein FQA39_LY16948 [Lamprigera yunnana]